MILKNINLLKIGLLTTLLLSLITVEWTTNSLAQQRIGWSDSIAQNNRGRNGERFHYFCPAVEIVPNDRIWGTDVYTDDSPICLAAYHAGVITMLGGVVTLEIRPGQASYQGSTRNNVSSFNFGQWPGSYVFAGGATPMPTPTPIATPTQPSGSGSPSACGTGTVWRVDDTSGAWKGIWVQQPGGSSVYSGRWLRAGEPTVTAILVISVQGNRVTFQRTDDPNIFLVTDALYVGTLSPDGTSASGTVTANSGVGPLGPFNWSAQISCEDPRRGFEINIDRPGRDYRNFEVKSDPVECWSQCQLESRCVAWTYVNPGVQSPSARCWLKDSVPAQVPNATFATSGVKG